MSGVSSSRTMDLSQLRSVRGDEKPIPLIWRNNKQVIQDLMKRGWLSHTEMDHQHHIMAAHASQAFGMLLEFWVRTPSRQ